MDYTSNVETRLDEERCPPSLTPNEGLNSKWMEEDRLLHDENKSSIPSFPNKDKFMWTSSYEANSPSEDRHASLVNMVLKSRIEEEEIGYIRMSMWCVLDGHGGEAVATYASEALLPHLAVHISRALNCSMISKGEFSVDGEVQDGDALDFEDILRGQNKTSSLIGKYLSKRKKRQRTSKNSTDLSKEDVSTLVRASSRMHGARYQSPELNSDSKKKVRFENQNDLHKISDDSGSDESAAKVGTHSAEEVDAVRRAMNASFLELDESWINSLKSEKVQTACVHGGQWNVGSCALVTCIIQRTEANVNTTSSKREASLVDASVHQVNFDAMLYTAHCGDCRAVLGVHRPVSEGQPPYDSAISDSESAADSDDDDQYSSDSSISDDEHLDCANSSLDTSSPHAYVTHRSGVSINAVEHPNPNTDSTSASYLLDKSLHFPSKLRSIALTTDHNPYNANEAALVLKRCRNDPLAISTAFNGGVKRVAGTLAITRALGDAYLKTPTFSFPPYKRFAPYISAMPQISNRVLARRRNGEISDRLLLMATDGLWERASARDVVQWVQTFFTMKRKARAYEQRHFSAPRTNRFQPYNDELKYCSLSTSSTASDYVVQCVLNRIVLSKNISSLRALMALHKGRARRSKHDDITATVVDLAGFVF